MILAPDETFESARFSLVRELGRGGMGVVYEAVEIATGAHVALKLLPRVDADALLGFKREFRVLSEIVHPNLVSPYELIADSNQWFFTMELVPGQDLLSWVRDGRDVDAVLATHGRPTFTSLVDEDRLRKVLRQVAVGVSALHQFGLLHRDLKPSNVLVRASGHVSILDFGLTVDALEQLSTAEHSAGTLAYMAPEQLGGELLRSASDWYAVGVMLYEALTGRLPFGSNLRQVLFAKMTGTYDASTEVVEGVPPDLAALCIELLRGDAAERATGAELLERLGGEAGDPVGQATLAAMTSIFVGRDVELGVLERRAADVSAGATSVVYVHGRSGAGKSALLQHFLAQQRTDAETVILSGRCYEQESVPFKAIDTIIDALTRWLLRSSRDEVQQLMPHDVGALVRVFPVLERVRAIADANVDALVVPDPRELRRRGFRALRTLLANLGARTHLVIAIDDLQWGDVDSAELLASLLDARDDAPMRALFIAAFRSEYRESSPCLLALKAALLTARHPMVPPEVSVEPLGQQAALTLTRALLLANGDANAAQRIVQESGGNPFFIGELARYANAHPEWLRGDTQRAFDLDEVLWSRVSRLPVAARSLLEIVAIAGRPLRNVYWRAATDSTARDPRMMAVLRHERLIRSTGVSADDEVETYHDRIREVVTARLSADERRDRHRRLADSLEQQGGADPETVASHFAASGAPELASGHYERAAHGAARALAFDRAAKLFELSLASHVGSAAQQRALHSALGDARANAGRGRQAAESFERAAELADTQDERIDLLRLAASQYCVSGSVDIGRTRFREVLRGVGLRPAQSSIGILAQLMARRTRLRLRGLAFTARSADAVPPALLRRLDSLWAASTALSNVDVVGVAALQSQALLLALKAGEPRRLALALAWEAVMTATAGTTAAGRAAELLRLAQSLADRVDHPQTSGMVLLSTGWVAFLHARYADALATCAEAEQVFRSQCVGVWWELLLARTLLAWGRAHAGHLSELTACIREWEPEARVRGDHFIVTNLLAFAMPHERMLRNDIATARAQLREALALWPYEGFHLQHVSVLFSEGMLSLYTGDGVTACAAISARWPTMVSSLQTQNQQTRVMLRDVRGRGALAAAAARIDPKHHLARAERDAKHLDGERAEWASAFACRLRAGVALARGDDARAVEQLRSALPALDHANLVLQSTAIRRRLGGLVGGDEGRILIADAESLMRERGVVDFDAVTRLFAIP